MNKDSRRAYYDAEPWYQREQTKDFYQQMEPANEAIKSLLQQIITKDSQILETACGGGWLAEFILKLGIKNYIGFDFSETATLNAQARLKNYKNWVVFRANALSGEVFNWDIDMVIAHQFLHCLIGNDRKTWLSLCFDTLKKENGYLFLSSMIGIPESLADSIDPIKKTNKPKNRYYAEDMEIQNEIIQTGFAIEKVIYPEDNCGIYLAKA